MWGPALSVTCPNPRPRASRPTETGAAALSGRGRVFRLLTDALHRLHLLCPGKSRVRLAHSLHLGSYIFNGSTMLWLFWTPVNFPDFRNENKGNLEARWLWGCSHFSRQLWPLVTPSHPHGGRLGPVGDPSCELSTGPFAISSRLPLPPPLGASVLSLLQGATGLSCPFLFTEFKLNSVVREHALNVFGSLNIYGGWFYCPACGQFY